MSMLTHRHTLSVTSKPTESMVVEKPKVVTDEKPKNVFTSNKTKK
jgi:hypothetical protein